MQPLRLAASMQWPARMPREGRLQVTLKSALSVADKKIPLSEPQFEHVFRPNISPAADVSDAYRATFCTVRPPCPTAAKLNCSKQVAYASKIAQSADQLPLRARLTIQVLWVVGAGDGGLDVSDLRASIARTERLPLPS